MGAGQPHSLELVAINDYKVESAVKNARAVGAGEFPVSCPGKELPLFRGEHIVGLDTGRIKLTAHPSIIPVKDGLGSVFAH